jgi:hypothetical protein
MNRAPLLNRRRALQLFAALGAAIRIPELHAAGPESCAGEWIAEDLEFKILEELGREYLDARREEADLREIASLLSRATSGDDSLAELRQRMRADYASGRIVNLSGWLVSVTEGCVFAVLAGCEGVATR